MADKFYVGDVGTDIILDCEETITGATGTKIKYKKPDGTSGEWTAAVYDDAESDYTSSCLKYTTQADDLDIDGLWHFQTYLTLSGWTGSGETAGQMIYPAFG